MVTFYGIYQKLQNGHHIKRWPFYLYNNRRRRILDDIPAECQGYVLEPDKYLTENGCKRTIKSAKSGFVTSYSSIKMGRALLNYVFRKTGVKMRIYAQNIGEYDYILTDFPDNMKKDIVKAGDCLPLLIHCLVLI